MVTEYESFQFVPQSLFIRIYFYNIGRHFAWWRLHFSVSLSRKTPCIVYPFLIFFPFVIRLIPVNMNRQRRGYWHMISHLWRKAQVRFYHHGVSYLIKPSPKEWGILVRKIFILIVFSLDPQKATLMGKQVGQVVGMENFFWVIYSKRL